LPALLAPLLPGALFFLIHTRDGLAQGGQRDLTIAAALVCASACLVRAVESPSPLAAAAFGLLSGLAFTIKPTALLLTVAQLLLARRLALSLAPRLARSPHQSPDRSLAPSPTQNPAQTAIRRAGFRAAAQPKVFGSTLLPAALAWLVAPALCLVFLVREHALRAFLAGLRTVVPYYAGLGLRTLPYLLQHSLSPILPLVVLWLLFLAVRPRPHATLRGRLERTLLAAGALFGLVNCILQARALPYYRYPLLAFLLPLIACDLLPAAFPPPHTGPRVSVDPMPRRSPRTRLARPLALAAVAFAGLFLAPQSALVIHRFRWQQLDMQTALQQQLEALGGSRLSGHIQCIDSVSGCTTVLYRMRLEPATGVLSDFLLFGNSTDTQPPEAIPVLRDTRAAFFAALLAHPPQVIVVTSHLHMTGPDDFRKLARWPAFADLLAARYTLINEWSPTRTERWWSREELPASFRVYTLRPAR
ncbi:MAG: hypothetical protein M3O02_13825, partial [Acidobacteriota bacterium]|nr:hypothetical protein [Acidobacteriota bacterium]